MSTNLKEVSGILSKSEYITTSLRYARMMRDELDAIFGEPDTSVITKMSVYVVHSKDFPMKGEKIK